jgi:F-type H+-transporting ATPase subunit b
MRRVTLAMTVAGAAFFGASLLASNTAAQAAREPVPAHDTPAPRAADPHAPSMRTAVPGAPQPPRGSAPRGGQPPQHNAASGAAAPGGHGHAPSGNAESGHGAGAHTEHDEKAPPPPINWWHGLLGEKVNEPPSILWREPGEPPPYLASVINFGILVLVVNRYGRKALSDALVKRKESITREIDEATRLRKSAEERLAQYEAKLAKISDELERVRREFREQGERDKERIVQEAKERRERMRKDTEIVLAQEGKQLRQELLAEIVEQATRIATEILSKNTTLGDHDRFAEAFLHHLRTGARIGATAPARGGSSYPGPAAAKGNPS